MKKYSIAIKTFVVLCLFVLGAIVYRVRGVHDARAQRAACYRVNLEKANSLEPSVTTINAEVEEIQSDQDVIDQLDGTDDEAVIYPDHDVALPAVRHQRRFEVQFTGHGQPCTVSGSTC